MKKKILSIALILGMMLSLFGIIPASASDITVADGLPYFLNDFEDGVLLFANGTIADSGMGGSKAMKVVSTYLNSAESYSAPIIKNKAGSNFSGTIPAGSTMRMTFWAKPLTTVSKLDFHLVSYDNGIGDCASYRVDSPSTSEWHKITMSYTPSADKTFNSMYCRAYFEGTYLIDDVEIALYKKGLIKSENYSTLHNYYIGFENGAGPLCFMINNVGYPVAQSTAKTNGSSTMQVVNNPDGNGKVLKYDMASTARGDDQFLRMSTSTGTGNWAGYDNKLSGSVPAGSTITYTFKYYWAQEMTMDNNPGFCVYDGVGQFASGSDFSGTAGVWHTATLTYTNSGATAVSVNWPQLRFCPQNVPGGTWTVADGNHTGFVNGGTSDFGARTVYLDDINIKITPNNDAPDAQAPVTSELAMSGEFASGNEVEFTQNFSSGTATDASIVKLVNTASDGTKGTLAYAKIGGKMIIPVIPEGVTLSFEVVPIDSNDIVGQPVSYSYAAVVGFVASLELSDFDAEGNVTAKVNMENMKHNQESVNAVLVVLMYDADGAMVNYDAKGIVCPYNTIISGETAEGMLTVTADSEAATAEAYLWDCGTSALPTFKNTTMKELVLDIIVAK